MVIDNIICDVLKTFKLKTLFAKLALPKTDGLYFVKHFVKIKSRDFDAQIAHITNCYLFYIFLAYFHRVNAYESLDRLFTEIKDELREEFD